MIYRIFSKIGDALERGFYIATTSALSPPQLAKLHWLIAETYEPGNTGFDPHFAPEQVVEIGPRLSIETPNSSNAVSICRSIGLTEVTRVEYSHRYVLQARQTPDEVLRTYLDKMTQEPYQQGIQSFGLGAVPEQLIVFDLLGGGTSVLEAVNSDYGLGMDTEDIKYYYNLFVQIYRRNSTDVELAQVGNANSEHSRHWFFKGIIVIDGERMPRTLFEIVQQPLQCLGDGNRSLIAFEDNAGLMTGFSTRIIAPVNPGHASEMAIRHQVVHISCTAETHNHPSFVAPFPGAATGVGGRIRDTSAVGRGGIPGIGVGGYFVGNLFIPGYPIPGEGIGANKPSKYASPLTILIQASDGLTTYGNQFGEPLTSGFTRSFGQLVAGEWREPRKPVLYSGGVGHVWEGQVAKAEPQIGMLIVRIGGPAYPIGEGGGAASSMVQGVNSEDLDFKSVQRGNAQEENKANRVIRACVEMGENNPISLIHDQGAGGPSNVLTELIEKLGGKIDIRNIILGDKTMSVRQIWVCEFQEGYGLLISPERIGEFQAVCTREGVNCEVLGEVDGSGKVVVFDSQDGTTPVNLELKHILIEMPQKEFHSTRRHVVLPPLVVPEVSVGEMLQAVFKLPSVGSKGEVLNKADRCVTGLVGQQPGCGIAHIYIADVSVNAQGHFGLTGAASSLGEQPVKMLVSPQAGARMAVAEMLTNMASVRISGLSDIRCRANWMWPAKLPHEGALLYDAAVAMSDLMIALGIAPDGGKDSLSMAATVEGELVKAPGSLVVLGYAPVPDITKKVTPDIKRPGNSTLCLIDHGLGKNRLGGSALAQACNQLGDTSPDADDPVLLKNAFYAVQEMVDKGLILAMHDRSDGGLITTVAEMCMASRCGFILTIPQAVDVLSYLFAEELGWALEVSNEQIEPLRRLCDSWGVPFSIIGTTRDDSACRIVRPDGQVVFESTVMELRSWWEETSSQIEALQMNPACAEEEHLTHHDELPGVYAHPSYHLSFAPQDTPPHMLAIAHKPRVAIIRDEGTNGDREMQAACLAAGLEPWDVAMNDLLNGEITLDLFQGVIFAGGFSRMDVFGSAKGWAATILFNDTLREMFDRFYAREDTFSLGVCNGCQLMALLGWVPWRGIASELQPRFIGNVSQRFECRWTQVEILPSPSIMLAGMAGSKLGVWVAHGEGLLVYPDDTVAREVERQQLAPLAFLDPFGNRTETYPYNPNSSPYGVTGLCSPDGRHLAMMPHPERCFRLWQWPWMPSEWRNLEASPWLRMFQNARTWCMDHRV